MTQSDIFFRVKFGYFLTFLFFSLFSCYAHFTDVAQIMYRD